MGRHRFTCIQPEDRRPSKPSTPGTRYWRICDEQTPSQSLFAGIVELRESGETIPLHYHPYAEELQFVIAGTGIVWDESGNEYPIRPGTCIYCPSHPEAAHAFKNTGSSPLLILCVFPSVDGHPPEQSWVRE